MPGRSLPSSHRDSDCQGALGPWDTVFKDQHLRVLGQQQPVGGCCMDGGAAVISLPF